MAVKSYQQKRHLGEKTEMEITVHVPDVFKNLSSMEQQEIITSTEARLETELLLSRISSRKKHTFENQRIIREAMQKAQEWREHDVSNEEIFDELEQVVEEIDHDIQEQSKKQDS